MSVKVADRVWRHSKHAGTELLLMVAIADFADDAGNAYPAVSTLAAKCRMSARNVNLLLANLRAGGELEIRQNEGPHGTNRYRIVLPDANGVKRASGAKRSKPLKPASPPTPEAAFTPEERFTLKPASRTPEAGFPKPLKPASDEPSLNRQEPSSLVRSSEKPMRAKAEHPLFAEFYAAYPRKAARQAALKAFAALDPDRGTLKAMLAAIAAQGLVDRCAGPDARFVPHPATWLNGRRWEDQAPPLAAIVEPAGRRPVLHADEQVFGAAP